MKTIIKSIAGVVTVAVTAFTLAACTSDPSTASESTVTSPIIAVSAETEETLESWLNVNPISNNITVDNWCYPENPDDPLWCIPNRLQLESGTVFNSYQGTFNGIACETATDTISYGVSLNSNTITKRWINPRFDTDMFSHSKTQFKESCKAEGGDITEDTPSSIACDIKIEPLPTEDGSTEESRKYYETHPFYNYIDPTWNEFATKAIEACRIRPQIEPIATF